MPYILEKVRVRLQKLFLIYGITLHASSEGGFTAPIRVAASEHQNVIIGKDVLIGAETFVMTSDVHVLYDLDTKKKIKFSI